MYPQLVRDAGKSTMEMVSVYVDGVEEPKDEVVNVDDDGAITSVHKEYEFCYSSQ